MMKYLSVGLLLLSVAACDNNVRVTIKVKEPPDASAALLQGDLVNAGVNAKVAADGEMKNAECCQAETATKAVP